MKTKYDAYYRTEISNTGLIPQERVRRTVVRTDDQGRPVDRSGRLYPMPGFPLSINGVRCRSLDDYATIFVSQRAFEHMGGC